jgi:hypothetical protein
LVVRLDALPAIYSCIRAFGLKFNDTDTNLQMYFRYIGPPAERSVPGTSPSRQPDAQPNTLTAEFGFNARYPERHNRAELEDPWAVRQLFLYQKCHGPTASASTWIFVQCPPVLRERIVTCAARAGETGVCVTVLSYVLRNWREYINHLEGVVDGLVGLWLVSRLQLSMDRWMRKVCLCLF